MTEWPEYILHNGNKLLRIVSHYGNTASYSAGYKIRLVWWDEVLNNPHMSVKRYQEI